MIRTVQTLSGQVRPNTGRCGLLRLDLAAIGSGSGPGLLLTSRNHGPAGGSALCPRKLRSVFN